MFAGSCIGVICLVCSLEFLRRLSREFDRYVTSKANRISQAPAKRVSGTSNRATGYNVGGNKTATIAEGEASSKDDSDDDGGLLSGTRRPTMIRPTLPQQTIRALLHMLQFGVAYFIM